MKVAGCWREGPGMKARVLAAALLFAPLLPSAVAAPAPIVDHLNIAFGTYFAESVYPPSDGSAWQVSVAAENGTGPFDVYIIPTTELVNDYPSGRFEPLMVRENMTLVTFDFYAPSRLQSFTLVIDNADNSRGTDAAPTGNLSVRLQRTPPLRSNPEAQAALSAGATICTAALAVATVGVAIYLKRKPRENFEGELEEDATRAEIDIEVPKPPRGAWAVERTDEAEASEEEEE